MTVVEAAIAQP